MVRIVLPRWEVMPQTHPSYPQSDFYPVLRGPRGEVRDVREALAVIRSERSRSLTIAIVTIVAMLGVAVGFLYLLMTQPAPGSRHGHLDGPNGDAPRVAMEIAR